MKKTTHLQPRKKLLALTLAIVLVVTLAVSGITQLNAAAFSGSLYGSTYGEAPATLPENLEPGQVWTGKSVTAHNATTVKSNGIFDVELLAIGAQLHTESDTMTTTTTESSSLIDGNLVITDTLGAGFGFVADSSGLTFSLNGASIPVTADGAGNYLYTDASGETVLFDVTNRQVIYTIPARCLHPYSGYSESELESESEWSPNSLIFSIFLTNEAASATTYNTNGNCTATFTAAPGNTYYSNSTATGAQTYTNVPAHWGTEGTPVTNDLYGVCSYSFTPAGGHWEGHTVLGIFIPTDWVYEAPPSNLDFDNLYVNTSNDFFDLVNKGTWQAIPDTSIITVSDPDHDFEDISNTHTYTYHVTIALPFDDILGVSQTYTFSFKIFVNEYLGTTTTYFGLTSDGWAIGFDNVTETITTYPWIPATNTFTVTPDPAVVGSPVTVALLGAGSEGTDITYTGTPAGTATAWSFTNTVDSSDGNTRTVTTVTLTDANNLSVGITETTKLHDAGFDGSVSQTLTNSGWITLAEASLAPTGPVAPVGPASVQSSEPSPSPSDEADVLGEQEKEEPSPSPSEEPAPAPSENGGAAVAGDADKLPQTGGIAASTLLGLFGLALIAAGGTAFTIIKKKNHGNSHR